MDTFDNRDGLLGRGMRQGRGSDSLPNVLIPMGDWARRDDARTPLKSAGARSTSLGNSSSEQIITMAEKGETQTIAITYGRCRDCGKRTASHTKVVRKPKYVLNERYAFSTVPWKNADAFSHIVHRFLLFSLFSKKEEEKRKKTFLVMPMENAPHRPGTKHD